MDDFSVTMGLLVILALLVIALRVVMRGPKIDHSGHIEALSEENRREEYLEQARRDGVDPEVAKAYATELMVKRRDKARRARERDERNTGDGNIPPIDLDI